MILIYGSTVTGVPTDNGLGGLVPEKCIVTEEVNGDFSLTMTHPMDPDGKWQKIEKYRQLYVPTHRGLQLFRIMSVDTEIVPGSVVVDARHVFYDLQGNFIESLAITSQQGEAAGDAVLGACQYVSGFAWTSSVTRTKSTSFKRMNPVQAIMGNVSESILNRWRGELARDNYSISHSTRIGANNGAKITYRKNMTALKVTEDMTGVYTRIYPTVQGAGNTIYKLPEKYIDSSHISDYPNPLIAWVKIDGIDPGSDEYPTSAEIYAEMRTRVAEMYADGCDVPKLTFDVKMVDLTKTEEYQSVASLQTVTLGDTVLVEYSPLSISLSLRVVAMQWDALLDRCESLKIGYKTAALTNHMASTDQRVTTLENATSSQWFDERSKNIIPCYESQVQAAENSYNVAIIQEGHIGKGTGTGMWNIAVGPWAEIDGDDSIAIGDTADVNGSLSHAVGYAAKVTGERSEAIGPNSIVTGNYSNAVGSGSSVTGDEGNAFGHYATVKGAGSIAVGDTAIADGVSGDIAIGDTAAAYGVSNVALGEGAVAGDVSNKTQNGNIAVGDGTLAKGGTAIAVGKGAVANGGMTVAVGNSSESYGSGGIAIGLGTQAGSDTDSGQTGNIAIGYSAQAYGGDSNLAVGYRASVAETAVDDNVAVGSDARIASGSRNIHVAPGNGYIDGSRCIVIGNGFARSDGEILIGTSTGEYEADMRPVIQGKQDEGISFMAQAVDKVPLRSELLEGQTANAYSVLDHTGAELGGFAANGGTIKIVDQKTGSAVKQSISTLADIPAEASRTAGTKYLIEPNDTELLQYRTMLADYEADIWGRM